MSTTRHQPHERSTRCRDRKGAGLDCIELHAALGCLIDEFFSTDVNLRANGYSGDLARPTRFGAERACRARFGAGDRSEAVSRRSPTVDLVVTIGGKVKVTTGLTAVVVTSRRQAPHRRTDPGRLPDEDIKLPRVYTGWKYFENIYNEINWSNIYK